MAFHIEGRRWFQRTYGNTYHSVCIYKDDHQLVCLPFQYGYGEQFIETALEWLEAHGHIVKRKRYANGGMDHGTLFLRETLHSTYSVIDVGRKRDL